MAFCKYITDRQLALLSDLSALEDAGMIWSGGEVPVEYDVLSERDVVETPGGTTAKGQELLARFRRSGATIFP